MHTDEEKKYDKRTIERNLRQGVISHREYEEYLRKIPDVSDKVFESGQNAHPPKEDKKKRQKNS